MSLDEFIEEFPTVTKEQVVLVLEMANRIISSKNIDKIYEAVA